MKETTPSFVLTLPLRVNPKEERELLSRLESARHIYNAALGEAKKRVLLVKQSKLFSVARKLPKNNKDRKRLFKEAIAAYDFNEYSLHAYVGAIRKSLVNNLDIHTVQKIATRAFKAASKILYGKAKHVRFKSYNQMNSVESKSNDAGIRWRSNGIEWSGLSLRALIYSGDEVVEHGLQHTTKYCRLVRKVIRGRNRFYAQLVLKGFPLVKEKNKMGKGEVCFDIGPSTIAIAGKNAQDEFQFRLLQFCSELHGREQEIHRVQQYIDRQKRVANPQNYHPNGKIKNGRHRWKKSSRQLRNEKRLVELYRVVVEHRKSLHGKLINETMRMGNIFKTENVSSKWLQKQYGKSVGMRAPGMYVSGMQRKAESAGGTFTKFATQTTKLSQICVCGRQHKKLLSNRVHACECGVRAQRDLFSAYLGLFVQNIDNADVLQVDQAKKSWSSADTLLQAAWSKAVQSAKSASGGTCPSSFGGLSARQSQSGLLAKEEIAGFEVRDVVTAMKQREPEREYCGFL